MRGERPRTPALRELGDQLERALTAAPSRARRRARPLVLALVVLAVVAVPAAAVQFGWADLVGGEPAVPPQAPAGLPSVLLSEPDPDGLPWQVVAYPARLPGGGEDQGRGRLGLCFFITAARTGAGRCVPQDPRPDLVVLDGAAMTGVIAGVTSPRVAAVTLRLTGGEVLRARPRPPTVQPPPSQGLPGDLRVFAVEISHAQSPHARRPPALIHAVARDASGALVDQALDDVPREDP